MAGVIPSKRHDSNRPLCTRSFIAPAGTWKIASKSNKWISLPIAPAPIGWLPTNCGYIDSQRQAHPYRTLFGLSAAGALWVGSPAAGYLGRSRLTLRKTPVPQVATQALNSLPAPKTSASKQKKSGTGIPKWEQTPTNARFFTLPTSWKTFRSPNVLITRLDHIL